jgi:molybdate/tungstate transport system permease protein
MIKDKSFLFIFIFLSSIIAIFLIAPLLQLFINVGFLKVFEALQDKEVYESIFLTFKVAFYSVVFVCITGIPIAYLIARYDFYGKSILETFLDIPVMVPHTAVGIALLVTFNNETTKEIFLFFGLELIDTTLGIMLAMMFLSAPFLINGAKEGFKKVDIKYEYMARTLGASKLKAFFYIALPNARNDILNGALMMWSRGLGEFGAVVIISYHPMISPVLIYDRFNNFGLNYSAPVAASMILVSVIVFLTIRFVNNKTSI